VIDDRFPGADAGMVLDGIPCGIPFFPTLEKALEALQDQPVHHLVIGIAPDGGRLPEAARSVIKTALKRGIHVDSGLHDFLYKDPELVRLAEENNVQLRDIRRTPEREDLHFFSGKIEKVDALKIAVLGTDSAVGKRTTAWILVHGFRKAGLSAEMVGTGQTAWLQGAKYSMVMDSCINDFVSGEIEHAVFEAWEKESPDLIVIEGQGSLMNPAYPGGFEILAAGRPDYIILQHAPKRKEYDGFPGYALHPLPTQIQAIELLSGKKVIAITVNHEDMAPEEIEPACRAIQAETGLPAFDVLTQGAEELTQLVKTYLK
jgi:uncharacterized NAD-dependent epimerase/dehydratase family protein